MRETPDAPRLPVWRWFTAPFEVLAGEDGVTAIMIMVFLLLIGGTFLVLNESGILQCMLSAVIRGTPRASMSCCASWCSSAC